MSYRFDNLKLEKGMYNEAGKSFAQVLEREDPSEQYKGTALEGLTPTSGSSSALTSR